ACAVEGLFQVYLRARALVAGHAARGDFLDDAITVPAFGQFAGFNEHVAFVGGMLAVAGYLGYAQPWQLPGCIPDAAGVGQPSGVPVGHALQLDSADDRLDFRHAPIGAEAFMQPSEAGGVLALVDGFPAFAVVFVRPDLAPQRRGVGGDHAAFAARGHDFVLAERPGAD